ncbi:TRAP-type C4-dicarboxylate transport system, substrate-binding protein [Lutimaribacter pacificus]|uniref:TRAP-type C4-dicarboxylate transport system, substrate-binding protein n=1 Tax=Lutimaribacter pacificus TaxID=391948 RepID=A0A1H0M9C6_9RHOB|nr:TRAP transporter substrate-binding protein DctP [Lutimaribacter pacificus]SDO76977.1 TRAP-type C4-dicarboxylate transport system, substrate-binding protein [Lutimaribacter pacificus]SHK79335.1 TRAP-type C4-dicarboxylate transport system, substrate-binding protein [Lutimaribacter pacificus]
MKRYTLSSLLAMCLATSAIGEEFPYSLPFNAANEFSQIGVEWSEAVSEATDGEIHFQPDFNAALVSIPEALDAVGSGVVPAAQAVVSAMAGVIPAFAAIEMGDGVPTDNPPTEDAMAEIFPQIEALLAQHDVKALWMIPAFGGGIACRDGFLETVDDWNGKKIRAAGRWQAKQVEAAGGTPIALPASDIYTALQNGTVDCALTVPTIFLASSMYEVAPYFSGYDFTGNGLITIVGNDVWEGLTDEQRETVGQISKEMTSKGTKRLREINAAAIAQIDEKAQRYMMTPEARNGLARAWDPVFEELLGTVTDETGKSLVSKLYSYRTQQ